MGFGGSSPKPPPPVAPPPPPKETDADKEREAELARQRRDLEQKRGGRKSLRIDPNPGLGGPSNLTGLRL
jgi:hypothetical protein